METPPPADVTDDALTKAAAGWGIDVRAIEYLPKGFGSYHWVAHDGDGRPHFIAVDDLDTKPWIAATRNATFTGLAHCYETARYLERDANLGFVVGPRPRPGGSVTMRLSDRHAMTMFPFVEGTAGEWGIPIDDAQRSVLLRHLAALHAAPRPAGDRLRVRPLGVPERPMLTEALGALDVQWHGGPFSEAAREALARHAADVVAWLERLDALAAALDGDPAPVVVTHGEPHPGNLMHTSGGMRLIDWDTVALARPERDLWMLGERADFTEYSGLTGRAVDAAAIEFYGLAWTLSDIASFTDMFRSPHVATSWIELKWNGFRRLLAGEPSAPYGVA